MATKGVPLVIVFLALLVGGGIWYFAKADTTPDAANTASTQGSGTNTANTQTELTAADQAGKRLSGGHCVGTEKPKLTHLPMDPADFAFILPYGLMVGGHVTPVDHQYFSPIVFDSPPSAYNVYAMADSTLVGMGTRQHQGQGQNANIMVTDYRLVFSISCRLFYYYDLVNSLAPGLEDAFNSPENSAGVPVTAGQLIGKIGGQTLDFAVWDTDKPLAGFIEPEHYHGEDWKLYTADPLEYYTEEIKAAALAKYVRTADPVSGRIDFDVDGTLVGNWFQVGTNGYAGATGQMGNSGYWAGHLSFSPYFLDPNEFLVSIGNWPDPEGASQFATREGGPDPATVDVATGLVKYTLVRFRDYKESGAPWDNMTFPNEPIVLHASTGVEGCMLVQMTADRALRAEAFKGESCSQVSDFTDAVVLYER